MAEPNLSQLDTLILENLKLQAQVVTLTAQLASLQARLDVQDLQQQYVNHLNSVQQPTTEEERAFEEQCAREENPEREEWSAFRTRCEQVVKQRSEDPLPNGEHQLG